MREHSEIHLFQFGLNLKKHSHFKVGFLDLLLFTAFQISSKIKSYPAPLHLKWQLYGAFQPTDSGN